MFNIPQLRKRIPWVGNGGGSGSGAAPPDPVTDLAATGGYREVVLTWTKIDGATGYRITLGGSTIVEDAGDVATYTKAGLSTGVEYEFGIYSIGPGGESTTADTATATTFTVDQEWAYEVNDLQPLAFWRFNENGNDSSTNARHLTVEGSPTYGIGNISGSDAKAVYLSSSHYAYIADDAWMDSASSITISAFVRVKEVTSGWGSVVSRDKNADASTGGRCWDLWVGNNRKLIGVAWKQDDGTQVLVGGTTELEIGRKYHIALRITSGESGTLDLLVNGVVDGTIAFNGTLTTSDQPIYIGRWNASVTTRDFKGDISDVVIVGSALTDGQLAARAVYLKTAVTALAADGGDYILDWTFSQGYTSKGTCAALTLNGVGPTSVGGESPFVQATYAADPLEFDAWEIAAEPDIVWANTHYLVWPVSGLLIPN